MDHFLYKGGMLHAEDVAIADIAAQVGTPFYCYSAATLTRHFTLFSDALSPMPHLVCFAVKSLSNVAVLKLLGDLGAGMDVVSGGEYLRAKAAGVPGDRIVFSGVGKTREEMKLVLNGGIRQFNVESEPELRVLSEVASSLGLVAPITLGVNPDVDDKTHEKIATGKKARDIGDATKRKLGDAGTSAESCGIDCSGFVSRCWKLPRPYSTRQLPEICDRLDSWDQLKPGDILLNSQHVLLFSGWITPGEMISAYEAGPKPVWRVNACGIPKDKLVEEGYAPWRYRKMKD